MTQQYFNSLEENEARITGVLMNPAKTFDHRENLATLKVSAKSFTKTFHDNSRSSRREHILVELHDEAARKARNYEAGDILHAKGQLSIRDWTDGQNKRHIRMVLVVQYPRDVNKIGQARALDAEIEPESENVD
ncbi:hypothetical protein IFT48_04225 [Pseudomonas fluorescens]|uniref:hypothetical protein n=1 Tax=Pseudomonas TaxID=286 RepID=UPI000F01FD6A|nr:MULTISPECIES: hypothetical protein [Pseudomonas]MBD8089178.1 hypothetical protein [Pseudomonas fluorescens]MBD8615395.1 hypothetical protein [Pseudomonas putida]MBD8681951.1 hypothetical protein [Pseudomonas sp. CFBP 13719]